MVTVPSALLTTSASCDTLNATLSSLQQQLIVSAQISHAAICGAPNWSSLSLQSSPSGPGATCTSQFFSLAYSFPQVEGLQTLAVTVAVVVRQCV